MNHYARDIRAARPDASQRTIPHDIQIEQAVLGAILMNNEVYHAVAGILTPDCFYEQLHQHIYETVSEAIGAGKKANPFTLREFMPVEQVGDMTAAQYLVQLASAGVGFTSPVEEAKLLRDLSTRRKLIAVGEDIVSLGYDAGPADTGATLLAEAQACLFDVDAGSEDSPLLTVASEIDRMMSGDKIVARPTVPFPLPQLEEVMGGKMEAGNLYGMLSGSGEGKTSMVLQIIRYAAELGHPVLFLSYDQLWDQCLLQMTSQRLGIESHRLKDDSLLQTKEREKKWEAIADLRNLPMAYKKCSGRRDGSTQIASYARRFLTTYAPRFDKTPLIVLDHVRKVKPRNERDHEGRISAEVNGVCKDIASEFDAVWLNLNQRSSAGAKRKNPRPIDADLFGGEMAREDYDGMFYLYRAWKYRKAQLAIAADEREEREIEDRFARERWEEDQAELGALKVRFGDPSVRRKIRFEARYTRYVSMRDEGDPALFEGEF